MNKQFTPTLTWQFLNNLNEGLIVATMDGTIQYINPSVKEMFDLQDGISTLDQLYQLIAPDEDWQMLGNAGFVTTVAVGDKEFRLESNPWQSYETALLQILVNPLTSSDIKTAASIEHLTTLTRISNETDFDKKLQLIVEGLQAVGWGRVILSLRNNDFKPTQLIGCGFTNSEMQHMSENFLPADIWLQLLDNEQYQHFRLGSCYFVPEESNFIQEHAALVLPDRQAVNTDPGRWHPLDILCVPLYNQQQQKIGLIGLDRPKSGRRPLKQHLQIIEL
jgi:hypothetical protein